MSDDRKPGNSNLHSERRPEQLQPQRMGGPGSRGPGGGGPGGGPGAALAAPVEKAKNPKATIRKLAHFLKPKAPYFLAILPLSVLASVFAISAPRIMALGIDELYKSVKAGAGVYSVNFRYLAMLLVSLFALYAIGALFQFFTAFFMAGLSQSVTMDLRNRLVAKLHRLPIRWFDEHSHGDILSRVTNDLDTVARTLQQGLSELLNAIVSMFGVVIMMLLISPIMTGVSIIILPLSILVTRGIAKRSRPHFIKQQKQLGELNGYAEEMISGHTIIKAFGGEREAVARFEELDTELKTASRNANFISGLIMPLMHVVNNLAYIMVAVAGGFLASAGRLSLGNIQAFFQYSKQFGQPIVQISQIINVVQSTLAAAERVFEVLEEAEEKPDPETGQFPEQLFGQVEIKNMAFSYIKDKPLIENLDMQVLPGSSVAIVGPTGAGKTTLVNLLMRFYELDAGAILVDGVNITDMKRGSLRSVFGMVLQDTWLFKGSIRDNIAYGKDGAADVEIMQAAMAAQADHFIRTLPDGYDTMLNEEATNISEGQRQLLTIARAFLADPAILILDEATSSVDSRTEILIQKAMKEILKNRTSFIIAHRLSTIRDADIILVMDKGSIIEKGSHEKLLAADGFYANLYRSQFA
ncbi:hypothetical protein MASR2M29_03120 [Spirochaetota bacterium]